MAKIPIPELLQAIGQHSLEDCNKYIDKCLAEYTEIALSTNYRKRRHRQYMLNIASNLVEMRRNMEHLVNKGEEQS